MGQLEVDCVQLFPHSLDSLLSHSAPAVVCEDIQTRDHVHESQQAKAVLTTLLHLHMGQVRRLQLPSDYRRLDQHSGVASWKPVPHDHDRGLRPQLPFSPPDDLGRLQEGRLAAQRIGGTQNE